MKKTDDRIESGLDVEKEGHPLRVLHIGNIANNAYLNAKILNRHGLDCYVLNNDYYHIMGCPEWEDADFEGCIRDESRPDWREVDLRGFERSYWFLQAPLRFCANSLKRREVALSYESLMRGYLKGIVDPSYWERLKNLILYRRDVKQVITNKANLYINDAMSNILGSNSAGASPKKNDFLVSPLAACASYGVELARYILMPIVHHINGYQQDDVKKSLECCVRRFKERFNGRSDTLRKRDFINWERYFRYGNDIYKQFNLVHAYATYGIVPLVAGVPYVVYEHGTIRHLPFQETPEGRLCALSYAEADHVFITNADNIQAAKSLNLDSYSFVPHPVNEDYLQADRRVEDIRKDLQDRLASDFIVLHPSRQHWDETRHPDWEKGNDIFIKGLARFIKEVNPRGAAVFVEWGQKVAESRQLLDELGIGGRVLWIPPLPNREMTRYIHATDAVADQFHLGAFGSTMPKALACGKPALLYLNEDLHRWCFDEMPPVINAASPEEVFQGLKRLYEDRHWAAQLAAEGRRWYEKYHSNKVIVEKLLDGYRRALDSYERKKGLVTDKK